MAVLVRSPRTGAASTSRSKYLQPPTRSPEAAWLRACTGTVPAPCGPGPGPGYGARFVDPSAWAVGGGLRCQTFLRLQN